MIPSSETFHRHDRCVHGCIASSVEDGTAIIASIRLADGSRASGRVNSRKWRRMRVGGDLLVHPCACQSPMRGNNSTKNNNLGPMVTPNAGIAATDFERARNIFRVGLCF